MEYASGTKAEISIDLILRKGNALPAYEEKSRKTDGLIYYIKGGHVFDFASKHFETEEGTLLYLPRGASYRNRLLTPFTEYYEWDFTLFENGAPFPLFDSARIFGQQSAENVLPLIERSCRRYESGEETDMLFCLGDLLKAVGLLKSEDSMLAQKNRGFDKIRKSVEHIERDYALNTSLEELARLSFMGKSNFEKLFSKCYGKSPIAYRNEVRIKHAEHLLLEGCSVSEAAKRTGFCDAFYFSKTFKKITSQTPGEYRNSFVGI